MIKPAQSLPQRSSFSRLAIPASTRKHDARSLSETIPLYFAISSPLIGVVIGLLGAWFVTWLTS
jgi:hypothetical protein